MSTCDQITQNASWHHVGTINVFYSYHQIPLSGYGGTSNIILEDQRKQADGYVATLTEVAVGCVSKVCLCVRNTGSRAAFVKAVAFSDLPARSVLEPSVLSLAPSQFVLKERTQEVRGRLLLVLISLAQGEGIKFGLEVLQKS